MRILAAAGSISSKRVDEVLDIVGLKDVAKKKPGNFSLGMSQRLGIAAAILGKPRYLILDEPANGLDPEGIAWLRQFIKDYASQGNGVFVSSHLLSEMAQMADNVVVIGKGKLIANTSVEELVSHSARSGVFVRTEKLSQFEEFLKRQNVSFEETNGGLKVSGHTTDEIGKFAFEAKVPVLELTKHNASLEDVYLELTEGEQEYEAQKGTK